MKLAGGIIAIIAGVFATGAALVSLLIGGLGSAVHGDGASTVIGLGWGGVVFAFCVIVFGGIALGVKATWPGIALIVCSLAGAVLGGTLVAVFMVLSLVAGFLVFFGAKKAQKQMQASTSESATADAA